VEAVDEANMVQVVEFPSQLILGLVINKKYAREVSSVADPGCLSRIRIFSHPGSQKTWGGKKKFFYLFSYLFVAFRSLTPSEKYLSQSGESTQNLFNLITILNYFHFLTQENIGFKLSEIMVGSGIRKKKNLSRIQGSKRYRIRIRNTGGK
jgi:hypothetical protein